LHVNLADYVSLVVCGYGTFCFNLHCTPEKVTGEEQLGSLTLKAAE